MKRLLPFVLMLLFGRCVADLMKMAREDPKKPGMLLVNAWNEYTEGSYLMPDAKNGDAYLRALKSGLSAQARDNRPELDADS